ncbi:uncharacterized protein LOC141851826 [Brevipalpus obovatus]|uniref:uncharacterized protein LOC141851826 n=1 Tax=Brevipalpus obovatus TaxID=246614 RepID=UPI003D9E33CB
MMMVITMVDERNFESDNSSGVNKLIDHLYFDEFRLRVVIVEQLVANSFSHPSCKSMRLFGAKATSSKSDKLEEIDHKIEKLEDQKDNVVRLKRKILLWILSIFGLLFICSIIYLYCGLGNSTLWDIFLLSLPMILTPLIAFFVWKPFDMYFNWSIIQKVGQIEKLKRGKDKVLKRLLENQSYMEPKTPSPPHPSNSVVVLAISPSEIQKLVKQ